MTEARQVLYLEGNGTIRVLRDGPSLVIKKAASADRRVPLRRLLRVVSMGTVEWSCQAMLACADADIAVCFTNRNGTVRGTLIAPIHPTGSPAMQLLQDYLGTVDTALDDHQTWVRALVRQAQLACARKLGPLPRTFNANELVKRLNLQTRRYARRPDRVRFLKRIRGLLRTHVRHLQQTVAEISPDAPSLRARAINLVDDYASILIWSLYPAKLSYLKRCFRQARRKGAIRARLPLDAAPRFYEAYGEQVEIDFDSLWRRHRLHLAERLHQHGD